MQRVTLYFYLFIGAKYNNLMENYKLETNRCKDECGPRYEALKKKYTNECLERKRLYNELIELRGNIRVFCRCRPLNSDEISKGYSNVVDFDPLHESELQIICNDSSRKHFKFDHVFGPGANQG
jgi:kinesin family member C2/C3